MATVFAKLTGDLSNIVDADFAQAQVRLEANMGVLPDPDTDKLRVLTQDWADANADGTFVFDGLVADADNVVSGTLQYYLHVRIYSSVTLPLRPARWVEYVFGPFNLTAGTQDISDMVQVEPVDPVPGTPTDTDQDVLDEANAYTNSQVQAHEDAPNPHQQYGRLQYVSGLPTGGRLIVAGAGEPIPSNEEGSVLFYGG